MKVLEKISSVINKVVIALAMVFLAVLLAASTVQIISRYVFNSSIVWTEELARYCFIWMNLLGTTVLVKSGGHAVVDLFSKKLKPTSKRIYHILIDIAIFYIGVVFVKYGWQLLGVVKRQTSPALHISMAYVYSSVVVCGVLICFHTIVMILEEVVGKKEAKD